MGSREGSDDESALLAALVELHRKKERAARKADGESPYARVLDHFERRGKRLAGERLVTEEMIGRTFESVRSLPPPPVQQELEITGPLGASASGRFRVQNRTERAARVEWVVGEPLEGPSAALSFEPPWLELGAGEAAMVRVTADLRGWAEPGSCTLAVECRAGGRRDRLWLTVSAFERQPGRR